MYARPLRCCISETLNDLWLLLLSAGGEDVWASDILNLGVSPARLIAALRAKFEASGGVILEHTALRSACIHPDGAVLSLVPGGRAAEASVGDANRPNALQADAAASNTSGGPLASSRSIGGSDHGVSCSGASQGSSSDGASCSSIHRNGSIFEKGSTRAGSCDASASSASASGASCSASGSTSSAGGSASTSSADGSSGSGLRRSLSCRLLVDCMGHYSPIVKQMRGGSKPDGVCIVVGSCATGTSAKAPHACFGRVSDSYRLSLCKLIGSCINSVRAWQWWWGGIIPSCRHLV